MFLKPGQYLRTGATLRQQSVIDSIQHAIEGIPTSPASWTRDLFKDIGTEGVATCLAAIAEARLSAGKASSLIEIYLNQTLTRTVQHLMEQEK